MAPRPKAEREEGDRFAPEIEGARDQDALFAVGHLELGGRLDVGVVDERKALERGNDVEVLERGDGFEERRPGRRVVEPSFPARVESLLRLVREAPEGRGIRRVKNLGAPVRRDREHGPRLREMVRARKAALQDLGAVGAKLSLGVPPALRIHFAASSDDDAHPQQPIARSIFCSTSAQPRRSALKPCAKPADTAATSGGLRRRTSFRANVLAAAGEPTATGFLHDQSSPTEGGGHSAMAIADPAAHDVQGSLGIATIGGPFFHRVPAAGVPPGKSWLRRSILRPTATIQYGAPATALRRRRGRGSRSGRARRPRSGCGIPKVCPICRPELRTMRSWRPEIVAIQICVCSSAA